MVHWNVRIYCLASSSDLHLQLHTNCHGTFSVHIRQLYFVQLKLYFSHTLETCFDLLYIMFFCFFTPDFIPHSFIAPSGPPENFEVKPLRGKGTAVIATWDPPEEPNGRIRGEAARNIIFLNLCYPLALDL